VAQVRIRIHIKRKPGGVPLDRLGKFAQEAQKLVRMIAREVNLDGDGQWVAKNFQEGSLSFDAEYIGEADESQAKEYGHFLESVDRARRGRGRPDAAAVPTVPSDVLRQYAIVGDTLALGESVRLGVYNGKPEPEAWCEVTKNESTRLLEQLDTPVEYHGLVQGIIHSLYKESNPPYFDLRELAGGRLIKCVYPPERYPSVVALLKRADAVVLVSGLITANRVDRKIEQLLVDRMEVAKPLTSQQFRGLFGAASRMTGDLTTTEFLDRVRGRGAESE